MNKPASELIALADRISGHLGPFNFITRAERELVVTTLRTAANQSGSERAGVDALREALDCLQSIADMEDDEPRQPDDADWRFRALECKRAAQCTIAALAREEIGAAEEIQSSDGGVEGHAAVPLEIPTQRSGESRDPLGDGSVKVGPHREDAVGIKPGPSEAPSTHGKPDGAVQEALVRLENACEAQRQSYRDHPEYSEGFYDAQCGDPLFDDATDPYRAGWEAFYVCKEIMDHNGFSRTADGSFEKSFTIGRALQQSQSQSQEGK